MESAPAFHALSSQFQKCGQLRTGTASARPRRRMTRPPGRSRCRLAEPREKPRENKNRVRHRWERRETINDAAQKYPNAWLSGAALQISPRLVPAARFGTAAQPHLEKNDRNHSALRRSLAAFAGPGQRDDGAKTHRFGTRFWACNSNKDTHCVF